MPERPTLRATVDDSSTDIDDLAHALASWAEAAHRQAEDPPRALKALGEAKRRLRAYTERQKRRSLE